MGITFFLARKMGAGAFGQWSLLLAAASWITVLGTAVNSDIIRKSAQSKSYGENYFIPTLIPLAIGGCLLGGIGLLLNFGVTQRNELLIPGIILALSYIVLTVSSIPVALFTGRDKMTWQYVSSVNSFLLFIGLSTLSEAKLTISAVAFLYLVVSFIVSLSVVLISARLIKPIYLWWSWTLIRSSFKEVAGLFMANWMLTLHVTLELFLLQFFFTSREVGIYSAAFKLIVVFRLVPQTVLMSLIPEASRHFAASDFAFSRKVWTIFSKIFIFIASVLTLSILTLSDHAIQIFYSIKYKEAISILMILSLSLIPIFVQSLLQSLLFAAGKYRELNWGLVVGLIVQATAGCVLIFQFGSFGAAVAFCVSEIAILICFAFFAVKSFGMLPMAFTGKMMISTLIAVSFTLIGIGEQMHTGLLLSTSILIYSIVLYAIGGISVDDIKIGKSMLLSFRGIDT